MSEAVQLGFDQMPRPLYRATPTRLLSWLDCRRRYRFTYLDRSTDPSTVRPTRAEGRRW